MSQELICANCDAVIAQGNMIPEPQTVEIWGFGRVTGYDGTMTGSRPRVAEPWACLCAECAALLPAARDLVRLALTLTAKVVRPLIEQPEPGDPGQEVAGAATALRQYAELKRRLEALTTLWRSAEGGCDLTCAADVQAAIKAAEEVR